MIISGVRAKASSSPTPTPPDSPKGLDEGATPPRVPARGVRGSDVVRPSMQNGSPLRRQSVVAGDGFGRRESRFGGDTGSTGGPRRASIASGTVSPNQRRGSVSSVISSGRRRSGTPIPSEIPRPTKLPAELTLRFWHLVYLGRDGKNAFSGQMCSPWFELLGPASQGTVLRYSAFLDIRPACAKRLFDWVRTAKAAVKGFSVEASEGERADYLCDVVDREGIVTHASEDEKKKILQRQQANPEMASPEVVAQRQALRKHPDVIASMEDLWKQLPKCPAPYTDWIDRQIYSWMSLRILETIMPENEREGVLPIVLEDWWTESGLNFFMDYKAFFEGIFAFVDVWCAIVCSKRYARRIKDIKSLAEQGKHQFTYSFKLTERHWIEWLVKLGADAEAADFQKRVAAPSRMLKMREATALSPNRFPYLDHWKYSGKRESVVSISSRVGSRSSIHSLDDSEGAQRSVAARAEHAGPTKVKHYGNSRRRSSSPAPRQSSSRANISPNRRASKVSIADPRKDREDDASMCDSQISAPLSEPDYEYQETGAFQSGEQEQDLTEKSEKEGGEEQSSGSCDVLQVEVEAQEGGGGEGGEGSYVSPLKDAGVTTKRDLLRKASKDDGEESGGG